MRTKLWWRCSPTGSPHLSPRRKNGIIVAIDDRHKLLEPKNLKLYFDLYYCICTRRPPLTTKNLFMSTHQKYSAIDNEKSKVYITSLKNIAVTSPTKSKAMNNDKKSSSARQTSRDFFSRMWTKRSSSVRIVDDSLSSSKIFQRSIKADFDDSEVFYCKENEAATVISALKKISIRHICKKEYPQALRSLNHALSFQQKTLGANHPDVATTYHLMGVVMSNIGENYSYMAMTAFEESIRIRQENFGPGSEEAASTLKSLWVLLHKESNKDQLSKTVSRWEEKGRC